MIAILLLILLVIFQFLLLCYLHERIECRDRYIAKLELETAELEKEVEKLDKLIERNETQTYTAAFYGEMGDEGGEL